MRFSARLLLVVTLTFALAGLLILPTAKTSAATTSAKPDAIHPSISPPSSAWIYCGGYRHPPSAFQVSSSGGYVGPDSLGNHCDGSFSYVLTPTSAYTTYFDIPSYDRPASRTATIWVYIPTVNAGAPYATYAITSGAASPTSWTINQEKRSGWQNLGNFTLASGNHILEMKLYSDESSSWYLAEDAVAINFN